MGLSASSLDTTVLLSLEAEGTGTDSLDLRLSKASTTVASASVRGEEEGEEPEGGHRHRVWKRAERVSQHTPIGSSFRITARQHLQLVTILKMCLAFENSAQKEL